MKTHPSNPWKTWSTAVSVFAVLLIFSAASTLLAFIPVQAEPVHAQAVPQEVNGKLPKPKPTVPAKQVSKEAPALMPKPTATAASEPRQSPRAEGGPLKTQPANLPARYNPGNPEVVVPESMTAGRERELTAGMPQQAQPEKITGAVLDPTGGVIPGVTISVLDAQTRELIGTTVTRANGSFEFVSPAGDYYIQFAAVGFQAQVFSSAQLGPGPLMVEMELGQVKEVVTVMTAAPAISGRPVPKKVEPIRVGGNVVPPRLLKRADPLYPPEARDTNVEGAVVVSALIDAEGSVKDPIVLSGHHLLRDAALTCVRQWQYQPALINGEAWPMRLSVTIVFKLQRQN